jgi:hypothetical protein
MAKMTFYRLALNDCVGGKARLAGSTTNTVK